jgi:hypothetical protein
MTVTLLPTVNEKTVAYLTVYFYDKTGALAVPSSATWKVHEIGSGTEILTETAIAPIASSYELTLTTAINTFLDGNHASELRRVTVKAVWGVGLETYGQYDYELIGLEHVL